MPKMQIKSIDVSSESFTTAVSEPAIKGIDATSLYARPYAWVKRFFDIISSLILLIPAGIIVCLCYIAIKFETKGPAFFVQ
ncbi:MAG: hypothetical protein RSC06_13565, partial [Clostridia bacterium]